MLSWSEPQMPYSTEAKYALEVLNRLSKRHTILLGFHNRKYWANTHNSNQKPVTAKTLNVAICLLAKRLVA